MNTYDSYVDLRGREISLSALDPEERRLLTGLQEQSRTDPDWNGFDNYWPRAVGEFYDARGVPREKSRLSAVYRIAQDISNRLAIAAGLARAPDYRDELEEIIRTRFRTRREFCAATGLSEDMLSHVLSRRRHLSMESLTRILDQLGYTLHIASRRNGFDRGAEPPGETRERQLAH